MGGVGSGSKPKHGMRNTNFYNVWRNLKARCNRPVGRNIAYADISYDKKWESFEGFMEDMFDSYSQGLELDRINPYGNYEKLNCRWVDETIQASNKRKKNNSSSKYFGVSRHSCGKFQVEVRAYGVRYYGGLHNTEELAAKKVNEIIKENSLPNRVNEL
jgi:hypothetical protein